MAPCSLENLVKIRGKDTGNGERGLCTHCNKICPANKPDVCLGFIDGVIEACCGHGWITTPYYIENGGPKVNGRFALNFFSSQGVGPPPTDKIPLPVVQGDTLTIFVDIDSHTLLVNQVRWINEGNAEIWKVNDESVDIINEGSLDLSKYEIRAIERDDGMIEAPLTLSWIS